MMEFLTSSLGWSIMGFAFGFVAGRIYVTAKQSVVKWVQELKQNQGKTRDHS
jgi:hypothetical protein